MNTTKPSRVSRYDADEIAFLRGEPAGLPETCEHSYSCECRYCRDCEPVPDWRDSLLWNAFFVGVGWLAVVILWVAIEIWGLLFGD